MERTGRGFELERELLERRVVVGRFVERRLLEFGVVVMMAMHWKP